MDLLRLSSGTRFWSSGPHRQARKRLTTRGRVRACSGLGIYPCYCSIQPSTCPGSLAFADRACRCLSSEDGRNLVSATTHMSRCPDCHPGTAPAVPLLPFCIVVHHDDAFPQYHRAPATMLQLAWNHDWWAQGRPRRLRPVSNLPA